MTLDADAWLFSLLREIRTRPGARLGSARVRSLENYLAGYMHARRSLNLPALAPHEATRWDAFNTWCKREKLNTDVDSRGWCEVVETLDPSDSNITTFFELLDEFLKSRGELLDDLR